MKKLDEKKDDKMDDPARKQHSHKKGRSRVEGNEFRVKGLHTHTLTHPHTHTSLVKTSSKDGKGKDDKADKKK